MYQYKDFLTPLLMKGRRLRADALFTQHTMCHEFTASTTNKGHGCLEHRLLTASTARNDFLARDWYGVGQVFRLRRRGEYALTCTQEIVYGMTSLTPKQADASRLLALAH